MSDYSIELFHADFEAVIPLILKYRDLETLENTKAEPGPQDAYMEIVNHFLKQYGKIRGSDYQMRFLSVMQFLEHYTDELLKDGMIAKAEESTTRITNDLLRLLLSSFKPPQRPTLYPSSTLHNKKHEFNYKKVVKAFKAQVN